MGTCAKPQCDECHETKVLTSGAGGEGRPTTYFGATVWSGGQQNVTDDAFGMGTAKNLGRRVAEVAMLLKGKAK